MMIDFFDMGGYGGFIWPSYAITFIALIWLFLASWQRAKTAARHLRETDSHNHNTASNQD
ncbi:MAG: heme exporter protein CcmD [Candidatus Puniceispirillaceae bacterium]